jgi:hypothetical protein
MVPVLPSIAGTSYQRPESAVGLELAFRHRLAIGYGIVPLPTMQQYLNQLLDRMKQASGVKGLPGVVMIRAAKSIGAESTPDGIIYLDLGIIENASSEDEIAGLLAHELGHIALGHFKSDSAFNGLRQLQSGVLTAGGLLVALQGGTGQRSAQTRDQLSDLTAMSDFATYVVDNAVLTSWGRAQEREADKFAVDILEKLGYSYENGLKSILEKVNQVSVTEGEKRKVKTNEILKRIITKFCPPPRDTPSKDDPKEDFLQGLVKGLGGAVKTALSEAQKCAVILAKQSGNNPEVARAFAQLDPGVAFFGNLSRTHDKIDDRLTELLNYREKYFPNTVEPELRVDRWKAVKNDPFTSSRISVYGVSLDLMNQSMSRQQEDVVIKVFGPASKNTGPFPAYALAQYQQRRGDRNGAGQSLQNAMSGNGYPALVLWPAIKWNAEIQIARNQPKDALAIYEAAFLEYGEPPNLLPEMVSFNRRLNNPTRVNTLMQSCTFKYPAHKKVCQF